MLEKVSRIHETYLLDPQLFCCRHFSKTEVVQNTDLNISALKILFECLMVNGRNSEGGCICILSSENEPDHYPLTIQMHFLYTYLLTFAFKNKEYIMKTIILSLTFEGDPPLPTPLGRRHLWHTCQKFKNIHRAIYIPNFALN